MMRSFNAMPASPESGSFFSPCLARGEKIKSGASATGSRRKLAKQANEKWVVE